MELMFCLLINQKQDGITFQTVDLMLNKTQDRENTTQNMFITTIFTLMPMLDQDRLEKLRELMLDNFYQKANSMMKVDGEKYLEPIFKKYERFKEIKDNKSIENIPII